MEDKIVLLSATVGTTTILAILVLYIRKLKDKLRKHVLRNEQMQKYLKER
ncbi:hypothetical protein HY498_04985 [Candidatus Woesearchaeota archaeon]|nr:hypothetical protein [Candidatus Woesearchaeota archaeon]